MILTVLAYTVVFLVMIKFCRMALLPVKIPGRKNTSRQSPLVFSKRLAEYLIMSKKHPEDAIPNNLAESLAEQDFVRNIAYITHFDGTQSEYRRLVNGNWVIDRQQMMREAQPERVDNTAGSNSRSNHFVSMYYDWQ